MARIRVVLDLNVWVSGLLWTGLPHDLIQAAEVGAFEVVVTPAIIEDLREVLARPAFAARIAEMDTSVEEL